MVDQNLGKKIGDYTLIKHLGSGQFGDVYRSKCNKTGKEWAVKIIDKKKLPTTQLQDMLKSEVAIMQKVNHRNVMHLENFMHSSANYYLIMQVCNNIDLRKYMEKKGVKM